MKITITFGLLITFILWNNGVQSSHHHHHEGPMAKNSNNTPFDVTIRMMDDLHQMAGMDENIIISPISIIIALLTTYKGAAGKTRGELATYLGMSSRDEEYLSSNSAALKQILKKEEGLSYTEARLAVGLYVQKNFPIHSEYIKGIQDLFPTSVANVDFNENAATEKINKFVSETTHGRIPALFPTPLDAATQLVIVSAMYFHGVWIESFSPLNTKPGKFFTGVKEVDVHMMSNQKYVPYMDNPSMQFEAIQLAYHDDYFMGIILPYKEQSIMNMTQYMSGDDLQRAFYDATTVGVDYKIPKIKFSWRKSLKSTMEKGGLSTIFEKADFSRMTSVNLMRVSDIVHAADIEVDEEGTKASSATAVNFETYSAKPVPSNPKPFYVNRPFFAIIYHRPTMIVLFSALVHQPNGDSA